MHQNRAERLSIWMRFGSCLDGTEEDIKMMVGTVVIDKSFDENSKFAKTVESGDFEEFFEEEGKYLDRLVKIADEHGKNGDKFTVTYTVTVEVE